MAEQKELTLEQKVDKLLILTIESVRQQSEIIVQQEDIIEKLSNISIAGEGFSYDNP